MREQVPRPINRKEHRARSGRVRRIARQLGFVGRVEYRHVHSGTGGAQYGIGSTEADDLLLVSAEAFQRDADPEDYSLEAILAHDADTRCYAGIRACEVHSSRRLRW